MMLSRLTLIFFFKILLVQFCLGQHEEIDKMIEYANKIRGSQVDSSILILRDAEKLSAEAGYLDGEIIASFRSIRQSLAYINYSELNPRMSVLQEKVKGTKHEKIFAEIEFLRGTSLMREEKLDSAVYYFNKAIAWYLDHDMKKHTSSPYVNLSKIYLKQHNYEKVRECIQNAYEASKEVSSIMQFITLTSLTRSSFAIGDYDNYAKFLNEGQELSKSFGKKTNDSVSEHALAKQIFNIEDDSLIFKLEKSIPALKKLKNGFPLLITYSTLGNAYHKQGDFDMSMEYHMKRLEMEEDSEGKIIGYSNLYRNRKKAGDDKAALDFLEKYHSHKDSVFQKSVNENIAELQVQLQNVEKDYKIREQKKQRNVLFSALVLLGLFGGFVVHSLLKRNRLNKRIFAQQNLLDNQKIEQLKKENQLTRAQALLEGQEVERSRIANDLHDGLGGLLTTVKAHYSNIRKEVTALREMKSSGRVETMIDEACGEVRRISHDLMPNVLRLDGLRTAVEDLVLNLTSVHNLEVDLDIGGLDERFEEKKETFIFRIIQELSNNIVKYAKAKNLVLHINRFNDELVILLEDDGVGFDLQAAMEKKGLGLKSTLSRVDYLNGEIDINTGVGKGTSVTINIPVD